MSQNKNIRVQSRADTKENWAILNPKLLPREIGYEIDTGMYKICNKEDESYWNELEYFSVGMISRDDEGLPQGEIFGDYKSNIASGTNSHAEGYKTTARGKYQHVQGKFNIEDTQSEYAHIVGNGYREDEYDANGELIKQNRSNAHTLDWDGNAWYSGLISCIKQEEIDERLMLNTSQAGALSNYLTAPFNCPIYLGKLEGKIDLLSIDENNETILKLTNNSLPINECFDMDKIQVNISLTDNMVDNYIEDIMDLNMIPRSNGKIKFLNLPTENILDKLIAIDVVVDIMCIGGNQQ